jgi:predicted unusual protein kinase regulating ubiquinone biosynthesis (AarF/ABC1/UbiB family)
MSFPSFSTRLSLVRRRYFREIPRFADPDDAAPQEIMKVIREDLGERKFEDVFEYVEEKAIAAASLAQVCVGCVLCKNRS